MRSEVILLLTLTAVVSAGRSRRALPAVCSLPRDSGECRGNIEGYYFNVQTGRCEMFRYGGCGGNGNHFSSERACAWACECRADIPPQPRGLLFANPSFCDRTCPLSCDCSGDTVKCRGPLSAVPQGISSCAKTIDLSNTGLQFVPEGAFTGLSSATLLDLSGNSLRCLPENAFEGLTSLETLRLGGNQLMQIPADVLQTLPSLQTVELQNNMLSFMACETIDNLPDLKLVNVSNNQLLRLIPHPGTPLGQMTIDVSGNKLPSFNVPIPPGSDGPTLLLRENPWVCDCRLEQLISHYASRPDQVLDRNFAICSKPSRVANQPLLLTNPDNMECLPREPDTDGTVDICQLAADAGPCLAGQTRYFYDPNRRSCRQFTYGGCLGNENNFASAESCERHCVDIASRPSDEPVTKRPDRTITPTCGANEEFQDCGTSCEDTCAEPAKFCFEVCVEGCFCREGYIRQSENGPCIREEECDPETPTRPDGRDPLPAPQWPRPPHVPNLLTPDRVVLQLPRVPEANPRSTFQIEYRAPTGPWQRLPGNPSISQPQQPVDNLQPNTPYTFRVRYYDPTRREESPWSREESVTTARPVVQRLPTPVWDSNPATPSTRQINVFLPPYEIPGAVYDVVYQQRPNGPLIPAGTVETDNRDPVPFTISDLQPGTPYQLFITARVGPRRSDRSRPLDTQTTDDTPQPSTPDSPEWPQPNNPSDVQPNVVSVRLPSNQPPTVLYDIVDSDTGRIIGTYPSNSPRDQRLPVRPSQVYRYGIRARDPNSGRTSPITSELRFLTPPEWPQPGNPVDEQPDSITFRLPADERDITYEVIDQDTNRVVGRYQPGSSRQQRLPANPERTYRLGIRSRDRTGLVSPIVSEITARTPAQPTETPLPTPVWTQRGSPSQRFITLNLPQYPVPNSLYDVYYESDSLPKRRFDIGRPGNPLRVTGLDPDTEYRFFVVARNGGRTSPESDPLPESTRALSTSTDPAPITRTPTSRYIVTWTISPSLEPLVDSFMIRYRPERPDGTVGPWVVADPAVPKEDRTYDLSFPGGGKYQIEVLAQPLELEAFKATVDIDGPVVPGTDQDGTVMPGTDQDTSPVPPIWPQPNNPSDVQPDTVTVTLPSGQPSDVVYDVVDENTGRVISTFPSSAPRQQQFPVRPGQVYRFSIRARNPSTGERSPSVSVLTFSTPRAQPQAPDAPVWPRSNNPANIQPNSVTVTLPSGQPSDVVYEVIDTNTGRVLGSYPANSPRQQQFPVNPDQVYRFGIRARDPSAGRTSPTSSVLTFRSAPAQPQAPDAPVWPSSNNPANIQPNSVTVTLPSGQPSDVVYEVIDTITGRVLGSYPANSPRQQQFPVSPDQVYRFGIRARDPSTGQTSPTSSVLNFRSPSEPTEAPSSITFPSEAVWPETPLDSVTPEEFTINLPAIPSTYLYDVFELVGRSYIRLRTAPGTGSPQQLTFARKPNQSVLYRIFNTVTREATSLSDPVEVTEQRPADTTAPTPAPTVAPSRPPNFVFPAGNPVRTSPSSVTLSFPASDRPLIYELYNIRNGRYEKISEIPSTSQIQEVDVPVQPGLRYRFTVRSLDANQRNLASPLSTPLDVTAPDQPEPTTPPAPTPPQRSDWPVPGYSAQDTTDSSTILFLPGIPNQPQFTFFDVEYRAPGGAWTRLPGRQPVDSRPQQYEVTGLRADSPYDFRFRYTQPGSPPSDFSGTQTIRTSPEPTTEPTTAPSVPDSPAWPSPSPRLTENTVQLTLPPAVPGVNYQVVWELPDGTFRVLGTFGPGDSRQQSFPIAPGQTYRFGLRSFSTTTQQVSPVGTFITITVPQTIDPVDPPSNGVITFPSPRPGQSLFVIRNSITGEIARLSPTTRTYTLPISTFPAGPQEITVETERGVVLVRYRLVIPDVPTTQLGGNGLITFPSLRPGQRQWVIRSNTTGIITRLSGGTRQYTLRPQSLGEGTHLVTVETESGEVLLRFIVTVEPREITPPNWPRNNPVSRTSSSVTLELPSAVSGYNYQIIREFPDGRTQVIGTYTSRDPRQQRVSVTPGEQYRFGLRSVSTSDPGAFSRALSFIQVTTEIQPPNWPRPNPTSSTGNSVRVQLPQATPGYNYQIIRQFPDGRVQVIGTYSSSDPRQQTLSVTPGELYRFGLRSVSTSDSTSFSRALSFIQVTTAIDPVDPPSNGVITFPSPQPGQSLFVIRNSITGEIARLSPTTRTYTLPISTFPAGPQEITVETERGVVLVRYRLVIPDVPTTQLGGNGLITFPSLRPGQRQWVIRSNTTGIITRLSGGTRQYTLRPQSLGEGTHLVTVETESGEVLLRFIVTVEPREITPPNWPRNNPVSRTSSSVTLELPSAVSGYNYQIIREFPDGRTQVIGTYTSRDPRQQRVSVTPGEQYRFGLRSVSTSDPGAFSRALSFIQVTTEIQPPNWPRPNPTSSTGNSVRVQLPQATPGYNYQIIRQFPDGRVQVIGTYSSSDPRQQTLSVTPGELYRFGLRSVSTSDSTSFSRALSFIQVTTEIQPPNWPRPNPTSSDSTSVTVQLPPAVPGYNYQIVRQNPSGQLRVIGTYGASDPRQQTLSVTPGEQYRFGLRSVSTGDLSDFSRTLSYIQVTVPFVPPTWPSGNPSQVTASSATLQLPAGRAGYELEIIRASQDGSRQTIRSVGSSQPRTQVIDVEGGSSYALGLRWKRLSDNALSGIGGYVTFNTPIVTAPATVAPPPDRGGSIENNAIGLSWGVNAEGTGVDVTLRSGNTRSWLGFGISRDDKMVGSDIITAFFDDKDQLQVQDRYAFGRTRPTIDTSNQVINPRGSIEDGIMRVSFTLPCNSDDERDVPLEGDRYILLAVGGVRNNDIAYHSLGRWISDLTTIKCGPGGTVPVVPSLNPFQLSGNTGTLRLPAPAGNELWIIESNVDGRIGTVSASERSFSFDISRLRAGDHVLTVSTERGAQLARVNIRVQAPGPSPVQPGGPSQSEGGEFAGTGITARWVVNAAQRQVRYTLCTSEQNRWVGFGISNDRNMAQSDIITARMNSLGVPVVEDRYATGQSRPSVDADSQVTNVEASRDGGNTCFSFSLPCNSRDSSDIPLMGTRNYLFAMGPVSGGDISYHSRRYISSGTINCGQSAVVVIDVDIPSEHMSGDDHWIVEVRRNLGRGKWTAYQTIAVVAVGETSVTVSLESGNLFELAFRGNVSEIPVHNVRVRISSKYRT